MFRNTKLNLTALCLLALAACAAEPTDAPVERDAIEEPGPGTADVAWEEWIASENERIRTEDAAFYDRVLRLEPQRTRNRVLRFTDPVIQHPDAAPILLHRLVTTSQDTLLRAALAEALPRTGGQYSDAAAALIGVEKDDIVRSVLVGTMRRAEPGPALEGLRLGMADGASEVRAEAARTASRRGDGLVLVPELIAALTDDASAVRVASTGALGALGATDAVGALTQRLEDGEADVRLGALRAIVRIDAAAAAGLSGLDDLVEDPDPRVSALAAQILASR